MVTDNKPNSTEQLAPFAPPSSPGTARRTGQHSCYRKTGTHSSAATCIFNKRGFTARALHSDFQALPNQE